MLGSEKNKRRAVDKATKFSTRIGEDTVFEGFLSGSDDCSVAVAGKVKAECDLSGILYIETNGLWQGNMVADVVIIAGTVEGNVSAYSKIELGQTGRVTGNLAAPAVAIAEGGIFDGEINMTNAEKTIRFKEQRSVKKDDEDK